MTFLKVMSLENVFEHRRALKTYVPISVCLETGLNS